jgi:beta-phosphoglucomutase-like phosphatase (HAD superfamily)
MSARAIVFDFNGTLSDDEPILCGIFQELFAGYGRPLSEADYYGRLAGLSDDEIVRTWLGHDHPAVEEAIRRRIDRYRELVGDGSTVSESVREAVRYAAARVPVAIVSGAERAEIEPVVRSAGIAGLFRAIVPADDVVHGKPHPEGYLKALRILEVDAADVVVFEDTEAGVAAAKGAGMRCLAVTGTLPAGRLAHADELVDRIDFDLLRRLLA